MCAILASDPVVRGRFNGLPASGPVRQDDGSIAMRLIIKYPTRSRPDQFRKTVARYIDLLAEPENTRFLFTCDTDDGSMCNDDMRTFIAQLPVGNRLVYGSSKSKVEAINRDLNEYEYPWDILLLASDDMLPNVHGYDNLIRQQFEANGPDHYLWINDGRQDRICTIECFDRAYYERDRRIYDPGFFSLWCDNLNTDLATERGRLLKAPNWITNESPDWGGSISNDDLYRRNNRFYRIDQRTYQRITKERKLKRAA